MTLAVGIPLRRVAGALLAIGAATGALYLVSWSGGWDVEAGRAAVRSFSLDVGEFGLAPAFYWLPDPERLVLAPKVGRPRLLLAGPFRPGSPIS